MSENTKYGTYALNTGKGFQNTAVGYSSTANTTTDAISNTSIGAWSLTKTTTGDNNVSVGCNSLLENTTGRNNVGVGAATLLESTTANNNTAVGANALQYNTTGSNNVAIGAKSGFDMTTQSNVICIGADSEPIFTDSSGNYRDNQTVIGNADITDTYIYGNLTVSGSIMGAAGPTGAQGPTGARGLTGAQGPTGAQGTVGVTGTNYGDYLYWNSTAWTVGSSKISLGQNAGRTSQGAQSVAIGFNAGSSNQLTNSVAIGSSAGNTSQIDQAVAIGIYAGQIRQGYTTGSNGGGASVAIGAKAGQSNQQPSATAIGVQAGTNNQGNSAVAIGVNSGYSNQGNDAIAIGRSSGNTSQKDGAIAIGLSSGQTSQANDAIAIGRSSGQTNQGINAIALGLYSASTNQGSYAIALGLRAGDSNQGNNSIAIGNSAGRSNQPSNSIVLNASGTALNGSTGSAFYVNPVRGATGPQSLYYDNTTKEITYSQALWTQEIDGSISANDVTIYTDFTSLGTNVVKYDCAYNSSEQLQYITYYDASNKVWYSDNVSTSLSVGISGTFATKFNFGAIPINDIGMSKNPDSSGNRVIVCVATRSYTNVGANIRFDEEPTNYNVIISVDSGLTWETYLLRYQIINPNTVAVSPDGNYIVIGGSSSADGYAIRLQRFNGDQWSLVTQNTTDQNIYNTAVSANNVIGCFAYLQSSDQYLTWFKLASLSATLYNFKGADGVTRNNTKYATNIAISKNTIGTMTTLPNYNGTLVTIPSNSYLVVSILDWNTNTGDDDNDCFSITASFTDGINNTGTGFANSGNAGISINGTLINEFTRNWKCYGVDVSPDGKIILVSAGYDTNNSVGTIPATYILVSYNYGATFNTLVYDITKDFGRIKVIPNPVTGNYDGSGSLLVHNNVDDKIYYYDDYSTLYKSVYNIYTPNDINCRNLYANSKVFASGVQLTSDYRIKDNVQSLDSSVVDLSKINPVSYYNKLSKQDEYGFIAHELQESLPLLVNGEKDGESYQSVNYIGLIPILVKEIQTLRQEVNELKNKV